MSFRPEFAHKEDEVEKSNLLKLTYSYFPATASAIVVMFGFGDMYANPQSISGHFLLTFQVILGYVLLGALVTRFAVLFTAGGPAGKFENEKKENEKKSK